jgi:hypothetical protein
VSRFIYDYAECNYAECRYAECRHAECRGARSFPIASKSMGTFFLSLDIFSSKNGTAFVILPLFKVGTHIFQKMFFSISKKTFFPKNVEFSLWTPSIFKF